MRKKLMSLLLMFVMVIFLGTSVFANENNTDKSEVSIEIIDNLLREANTPESEIQGMDAELKKYIYDNSLSQQKVEYVEVKKEQGVESRAGSGYSISTSKLKLSVLAYKVYGKNQVDIYPSYEWLVPVKPKGKDYFGYSTHSSFSAVPGKRSNLIWSKINKNDSWTHSREAIYTGTSMTGYQHSGKTLGTPDFPIYIKGHFYYRCDIDASSPVKKIVLAYVHDTSIGSSLSYGIGFGPLSISINPRSSNVGYQNNIYSLNY